MRNLGVLFSATTLVALVAFACGDSDPTPTQTPAESEAGTDGGSSVPNDGQVSTPDGGVDASDASDASADADASVPGTPVTVTVGLPGVGPLANAVVLFHDASGAVLERVLTGANGKASSTGTTPAMVTALFVNGARHELVTWGGVMAGDQLVVRGYQPSPSVGSYDVTMPAHPNAASIDHYEARTDGCSNTANTSPIAVGIRAECLHGAQSSVLATAFGVGGNVLGFSFKKTNAAPNGGAAVAVTTNAWQDGTPFTLDVTNAPASNARARLAQLSEGAAFQAERPIASGEATFALAPSFAGALQASVYEDGALAGSSRSVTKHFAVAASSTIDFSVALPLFTARTITGTDARRPTLSWSTSGAVTAADADGMVAVVDFDGPLGESSTWSFVLPPTTTSIVAPATPSSDADIYLPASNAAITTYSPPALVIFESNLVPSYDALRGKPALIEIARSGFEVPTLAQDATLRMSVVRKVD
jgi:hypothetical protein